MTKAKSPADQEVEACGVGEEGGVDRLTEPVTLADAIELADCVPATPARRPPRGFATTE